MSAFALKPSFANLPPEILSMIAPGPEHHGRFNIGTIVTQQKYSKHLRPEDQTRTDEVYGVLRSLAHVCRSLRAYALPLLWKFVSVETVRDLGRLREVLRASPFIAPYVRDFGLHWFMDGECTPLNEWHFDKYPAEEGTLLDMAFRDRNKMWEDLGRKLHCKFFEDEGSISGSRDSSDGEYDDEDEGDKHETTKFGGLTSHFFVHEGIIFRQPGRPPYLQPRQRRLTDMFKSTSSSSFTISGPDGNGQDRYIKTAQRFSDSVDEIVSQLTNLEVFTWDVPVAPMPRGTCDTLAKLSNLTSLSIYASCGRGMTHALPFWNLTRKLGHLHLRFTEFQSFVSKKVPEEQEEEAFTAFELPTEPLTSPEARYTLHNLIACRTVAAAARSGHLQTLNCQQAVQAPFAVRSLLPHWVALRCWNTSDGGDWHNAAGDLRCLLAHASLWLGTAPMSGPREDPELTPQEIQQLPSHLHSDQPMELKGCLSESEMHLLERCLAWLQSEELAQRVADAWKSGLLSPQVQDYQKAQVAQSNSTGFLF